MYYMVSVRTDPEQTGHTGRCPCTKCVHDYRGYAEGVFGPMAGRLMCPQNSTGLHKTARAASACLLCCCLCVLAVQAWLQEFMTACRGAVADADPKVVEAIRPDIPRPITNMFNELEAVSVDDEDEMKRVGRAHVTVLEPPTFTSFQRTSATFFAAFVLYGSSCRE